MLSPSTIKYLTVVIAVLLLACGCLKQIQAGTGKPKTKAKSQPASHDKSKSKAGEAAMADASGLTEQASQELSAGINQFGLRLYLNLRDEPGNLFISPYSMATALSMVYEGAAGQTADEIHSVIEFPREEPARQAAVAALHNALNPKDASYQLSVANGIWAQQDYPLLPEYLNVLKTRYASEAASMDFMTQAEPARQQINKWVAERTNERIKELFAEGLIREDAKLVLANAIFFKGLWARQFDPERSFDGDFRTPSGPVKAKFMLPAGEDKDYAFFENELLKAIELPYEGDSLSMLVVLPKGDDLTSLDPLLLPAPLADLSAKLVKQDLLLQLPRFTFMSKFDMGETLAQLGMPMAFSDDADFSGMTGGRDLKIGAAVHQAFVEVNEEGTEAAAASGIVMRPTGAAMNPTSFIADHPFIFFIRDKASGAILFMGRVEDPTAK